MTDSLDVFNELRNMRNRVEAIEHNTEILIRANSQPILDDVLDCIRKDPLLGHIYLLVDRRRTQEGIVASLKELGHPIASDPTVSRRIKVLSEELHLIELVQHTRAGKVYGKTGIDRILGLTRRVQEVLEAGAK